MRRAIILLTFTAAAIRQAATRWVTGITYRRSGRADRVTSQFWAGWDTGTEGNLTVDLPYLQDGYPGADLVPLPPWESTPQLVTTLNLPAQVSSRPTVSDPEGAMGVNAPHLGGESDSPGSAVHALSGEQARPAGGLNTDSGLMPAVTEHVTQALGVSSRTRWLDEAFDRVLLDLRAEMAILDHRYAYAGATA